MNVYCVACYFFKLAEYPGTGQGKLFLDASTNLRTNNYKNELYIFKYPGTGQGEPWNLIIVFVQKMEASRNLKIRR